MGQPGQEGLEAQTPWCQPGSTITQSVAWAASLHRSEMSVETIAPHS